MIREEGLLAHEVFELYNALGADSYIEEVRRPAPTEGPINIEETADAAGINLFMPAQWAARGSYVYWDKPRPSVYVAQDQSIHQQDLTFGHELGHHFLMRHCQIGEQFDGVDDFCEYFGAELIKVHRLQRAGQLLLLRAPYA